jgi:hypothetical protein
MSSRGSEQGYQPKPKIYNIKYDDHPGLLVRARSVDAGTFMRIAALADLEGDPSLDELKDLYSEFAKVLLSWNLLYFEGHPLEGQPVPTTLEGLLSQEWDFLQEIILGWMSAVSGVSAPLDRPSTSGSLSLVESLPMDVSSPNQLNSAAL